MIDEIGLLLAVGANGLYVVGWLVRLLGPARGVGEVPARRGARLDP